MTRRNLITLGVVFTLFAFGSVGGFASVVSDPQYYLRAVVAKVQRDGGGPHTISFIVQRLVERQEKYGGYRSPNALPNEVSTKQPRTIQITLNPRVSVKPGDTIVVGVIHGSTMGESEPAPWVMFAQPYLEDGTPIGNNYASRN